MSYIIGADEVGYGAWAGPLVTCAVAVPEDWMPPHGLNDSKKIKTVAQREYVYGALHRLPLYLSLVSSEDIDKMGVGKALVAAHTTAIRSVLSSYPDSRVILDGNVRLPELPGIDCIPKADGTFPAVMAASVIAKVNRDRLMREYALRYTGYAFDTSMGYGTKEHSDALNKLGPCPIHRQSYAPVQRATARPGLLSRPL